MAFSSIAHETTGIDDGYQGTCLKRVHLQRIEL